MTASTTPQFEHSCPNCQFLGRHTHNDRPVDLYVHTIENEPFQTSFIARYSDAPADYTSGLQTAYFAEVAPDTVHPLQVAKDRAVAQGIVEEPTWHLGYSERRQEELAEVYFASNYYRHRPDLEDEYMYEDDDPILLAHEAAVQAYDEAYMAQHGEIPTWDCEFLQFFDSAEQAETYCRDGEWAAIPALRRDLAEQIFQSGPEHKAYLTRLVRESQKERAQRQQDNDDSPSP